MAKEKPVQHLPANNLVFSNCARIPLDTPVFIDPQLRLPHGVTRLQLRLAWATKSETPA